MNYVVNFLAQTEDRVLHSYWHLDILICDYRRALQEGTKLVLFIREKTLGGYRYIPTTYENIIQIYE